jgi:acetyl-CoA C-acetyltransferase
MDPRTPVVIGVGQASERLGDPGYLRLSPVSLAAGAARAALDDAGAPADAIDTVAGVRQFELSYPGARAPLGRSNNFPRSVAARLGAGPSRVILEVVGGQSPQKLVSELAGLIAADASRVALIVGAEAISTVSRYRKDPARPDFSESIDGSLEDRGFGLEGQFTPRQFAAGLLGPTPQYALFENARRARLGQTRAFHAASMGALFSPFSKVAAANPHSVAPVYLTADELITPTEKNRPIADPYLRYLVSREKVNQGAAVLLASVQEARRLGVPEHQWVYLHGHADLVERPLMERADLSTSPASVLAARHALDVAGIGVDDLATIDLYSCFPIPVFNICEGLGLAADDPRGLTVTGGLPFFGGPGNNYSAHAIASTVLRLREAPGTYGFVGANGGVMSKYSAGVYSTTPAEWRPSRSAALQAEIDAWEAPAEAVDADGPGTIETYTVVHGAEPVGVVIGRLDDGRRFLARSAEDALTAYLATAAEPIGSRVQVSSSDAGNRATLSSAP